MVSTTAVIPSTSALASSTPASTRRTSPGPTECVSAAAVSSIRRPSRRDTSNASSDASVMIPSPPAWIRPSTTSSPNVDQCDPVSTEARPPQIAPVAVNSAVTQPVGSPLSAAIGSVSSTAPIAVVSPNATTTTRAGCRQIASTPDLEPISVPHSSSVRARPRSRSRWQDAPRSSPVPTGMA
jgi:hypothetical protein